MFEAIAHLGWEIRFRERQPQNGIELIDGSECVDPQSRLVRAAAAEEIRGAVVAAACRNGRSHGCWIVPSSLDSLRNKVDQ